jgi:hypothetical protein
MLKYFFFSSLIFFCLALSCRAQKERQQKTSVAETKKPNIIFILADDLGCGV